MTDKNHKNQTASPTDSTICAFDDPVPSGSRVAIVEPDCCESQPHGIEKEVHRRLLNLPGLQIHSLTVHRLPDGVCLEGTLETDRPCPDIASLMREIDGVERVVNRLRVQEVDRLSAPIAHDDETVFM